MSTRIEQLKANGVVGLTKSQMAAMLQVCPRTITDMMRRGEIAYYKIGRRLVRFPVEHALKRMEETVLIRDGTEKQKTKNRKQKAETLNYQPSTDYMTALQMAYAECANWRKDGKGCLGAIIDDDLQIRQCAPRPRCLLSTPGQRCQYFEECVAPMAASIEDPRRRLEFEAAVRDYRLAANLPHADDQPCPICGRAREARHRFCENCAAARRKDSTRRAVQKYRVTCKQLSPKSLLGINDLQGAGSALARVVADRAKTPS